MSLAKSQREILHIVQDDKNLWVNCYIIAKISIREIREIRGKKEAHDAHAERYLILNTNNTNNTNPGYKRWLFPPPDGARAERLAAWEQETGGVPLVAHPLLIGGLRRPEGIIPRGYPNHRGGRW